MMSQSLTLKQIEVKLQTKQHVLIHLCEKGVITPDIQQTQGRGSHREFSLRNLFEFAVALTIRKYGIPVVTTAAIVRVLRSFERSTKRHIKGFSLLGFLQQPKRDANIVLILYDGHYIVFGVEVAGKPKSITGFDLESIIEGDKKPIKIDRLDHLPGCFDSYLIVNLKRLAEKVA